MYRFSRLHLLVSVTALLGIAQFLVGVAMAVRCYPPGIQKQGYSVCDNFLSDLGCSQTRWREDNSVSATIFNRSAIILGVSLIPFFAVLPTTVIAFRKLIWFSGVLSALGLIGIGLTPYDLYFAAHMTTLGVWLVSMFVLFAGHLIASSRNEPPSFAQTACTVLLLLAILAYALAGTRTECVILQKLTVSVAILWFFMIGRSVAGAMIRIASSRFHLAERQAERYMETIRYGHRRLKKTTYSPSPFPPANADDDQAMTR
jgi:hypothetical protein